MDLIQQIAELTEQKDWELSFVKKFKLRNIIELPVREGIIFYVLYENACRKVFNFNHRLDYVDLCLIDYIQTQVLSTHDKFLYPYELVSLVKNKLHLYNMVNPVRFVLGNEISILPENYKSAHKGIITDNEKMVKLSKINTPMGFINNLELYMKDHAFYDSKKYLSKLMRRIGTLEACIRDHIDKPINSAIEDITELISENSYSIRIDSKVKTMMYLAHSQYFFYNTVIRDLIGRKRSYHFRNQRKIRRCRSSIMFDDKTENSIVLINYNNLVSELLTPLIYTICRYIAITDIALSEDRTFFEKISTLGLLSDAVRTQLNELKYNSIRDNAILTYLNKISPELSDYSFSPFIRNFSLLTNYLIQKIQVILDQSLTYNYSGIDKIQNYWFSNVKEFIPDEGSFVFYLFQIIFQIINPEQFLISSKFYSIEIDSFSDDISCTILNYIASIYTIIVNEVYPDQFVSFKDNKISKNVINSLLPLVPESIKSKTLGTIKIKNSNEDVYSYFRTKNILDYKKSLFGRYFKIIFKDEDFVLLLLAVAYNLSKKSKDDEFKKIEKYISRLSDYKKSIIRTLIEQTINF